MDNAIQSTSSPEGMSSDDYFPVAPSIPSLPVLNLGQDSPLDMHGESSHIIDQKGISTRWLIASIVIALAGAALIGTSLIIAMKGTNSFVVTRPDPKDFRKPKNNIASKKDSSGMGDTLKKTDKFLRSDITVSAKRDYKARAEIPTARGVAYKNRQFIRMSTSLALRTGVYSANIPKFNANRLLNQDGSEETQEPTMPVEVSDADVSIIRVDLSDIEIPENAPAWTDDEISVLVGKDYDYWGSSTLLPEHTKLAQKLTLLQGSATETKYAYSPTDINPFTSIDVQVTPENVTPLTRSTSVQISSFFEERNIVYRKGESFEDILKSFGADQKQAANIVGALGGRQTVDNIADGQYVRALFAPLGTKLEGRPLVRIMIIGERGIEAIAAANDRGAFVSVPPPVITVESSPELADDDDDGGREGARLYESVHETLAKNDLPRAFADDLVRIFGYEIDFQRRVSSGDTIEIFYSRDEETSTTSQPELLFASLTLAGDHRPVFRYLAKDGNIEYFDPAGRSLKKFLLRKPVGDAVLRSGFGMRHHPILKYSRLHAGVDWSGPTGTPIYAAGNGVIIKAGRSSGYGNRIEIQHANGYMTSYSHQSRFANGIDAGVKVKQGQHIGYIGNTGLSTGPHLHYEVKINGNFVDPMTIRVPRTRELTGSFLDEFKTQRDIIIEQIKKTGATSLSYARTSD